MTFSTFQPAVITIAAAALCRADGHTLLVRKRGTTAFMQPGGKIEPGEEPISALLRELQEELGIIPDPEQVVYLGHLTAPAANEPGSIVEADIFRIDIDGVVHPAAEIEEATWIIPSLSSELELAPLTRHHILPMLVSRR